MDNTEQGLVEIIPLEGNYPTIRLTGGALPYKGTTFPREQRGKTTYYPGNPVASQTVTGPTRPPTTMTGRWMDFDLGEGGARALDLQIGILCDKGVPVEVRWGGRSIMQGASRGVKIVEDPAIVQRGRISKYEPKYNRAQDIEWSITFEWRGDALQTKPPTFSAQIIKQDSFTELADQLAATQEATQSWIDIGWAMISTGVNEMLAVQDALDEVQNAVFEATYVVNGASDMLQTVAELPSAIADRVRGMCDFGHHGLRQRPGRSPGRVRTVLRGPGSPEEHAGGYWSSSLFPAPGRAREDRSLPDRRPLGAPGRSDHAVRLDPRLGCHGRPGCPDRGSDRCEAGPGHHRHRAPAGRE